MNDMITCNPNKRIMTLKIAALSCVVTLANLATSYAEPTKPLMRDFMGINAHISFKPELYREVSQLARSYHNISWDVEKPGDEIVFPENNQGFNWDDGVYASWKEAGFEIDLCAQFGTLGPKRNDDFFDIWENQEGWMEEYGYTLAKYRGKDGKKLFTSIEIGNEPGEEFDSELYTTLFKGMARGIRRASPETLILTCTVKEGDEDRWAKSLNEIFDDPDIKKLYDVISIHTYALLPRGEGEHPWERTFPENDNTEYLSMVNDAIEWRNKNAPGKPVWITEFGWDAPSEAALSERTGGFKQFGWRGETELNQAQWLVRSFLLFSERDVGRAYLYFYNDKDRARTHGASGLTRNFKPKKSFWAIKHLYDTLGDYRFSRVVTPKSGDLYVYEYKAGNNRDGTIWVAWSPTGDGQSKKVTLKDMPARPKSVELSPMEEGSAPEVPFESAGFDAIKLEVTETPVFIKM